MSGNYYLLHSEVLSFWLKLWLSFGPYTEYEIFSLENSMPPVDIFFFLRELQKYGIGYYTLYFSLMNQCLQFYSPSWSYCFWSL